MQLFRSVLQNKHSENYGRFPEKHQRQRPFLVKLQTVSCYGNNCLEISPSHECFRPVYVLLTNLVAINRPDPERIEKINENVYFHTSL